MNTEIRLTSASFSGVGSDKSSCQGINVGIAAETRLARSISAIVGSTNIQTCLPKSLARSLNTDENGLKMLGNSSKKPIDLLIERLCILSESGREDLNFRPHGPEPCALAKLSYAPPDKFILVAALILSTPIDEPVRYAGHRVVTRL